MRLTGAQFSQIQEALLAAYDEAGLRQMVRIGLNADLPQIAGGSNLTEITHNLVAWADRQSRVQALIDAAVAESPLNTALQTLQQDAQQWHLAAPAGQEDPEPYKGLDFFDVGDAELFFGREHLTAELVAYLCGQHLLAVVGASGSGKSSLVRAGVVPALQTGKRLRENEQRPVGSDRWLVHIITPTAHPLESLAIELIPRTERKSVITDLIDDLVGDPRSLHLHIRQLLRQDRSGERLLLIVDQFEELFTLCRDQDERKTFVDNLLTAAAPDGVTTVVLTLRADFYAHCAEFDNLRQALERCQRYIGAMSEQELRQAIETPAVQSGWDLEPGLVDLMLEDVAQEPGALPLLSHALLETWKRRSGRMLTLAGYQASGRVQGAIAQTADSTYAALAPSQQAIAKNIFLRLTTLGEGVQDTRRRVPLAELVPGAQARSDMIVVLQALQDARLVTTVREAGPGQDADQEAVAPNTYVDVAHEALIREWRTLREWLQDDREGLRTHRHLTESVEAWLVLEKDPGELYRSVRLERVLEWAAEHGSELNEFELEFLDASKADRDRLIEEEKELEREREEARQQQLKAAEALAEEAEARRKAEAERAEVAEASAQQQTESAQKLLRRAYYLGAALVVAIIGVFAAVVFFVQAENRADEASRQQQLTESLLSEVGQAIGALGTERLLAIITELVNADSVNEAIALLQTAADTLSLEQVKLILTAVDQRSQGFLANGDSEVAERLLIVRGGLELYRDANDAVYIFIPPGAFTMGSDPEQDLLVYEDESPQHTLDLDSFWIMRTEVTNAQYGRCVDAGVCSAPANDDWNRSELANRPVTTVTWRDASTYAKWVNGQLPTEAQWEKACRGTDARIYPWGNESPTEDRLNYADNVNATTDVGSYPPGAYGLYDMAGNVWEWTSSKYKDYPYDPADGREDPEGDDWRTLRGGSFAFSENIVRCAYRFSIDPDFRLDNKGFRVVVSSPGS